MCLFTHFNLTGVMLWNRVFCSALLHTFPTLLVFFFFKEICDTKDPAKDTSPALDN